MELEDLIVERLAQLSNLTLVINVNGYNSAGELADEVNEEVMSLIRRTLSETRNLFNVYSERLISAE